MLRRLEEVLVGKHPDLQTAIEYELAQLEKALATLHINKGGHLVKRIT
jgi:hypothetical protein